MAKYTVKATAFFNSNYKKEFDSLLDAKAFFDSVTEKRNAIARYNTVRIVDDKGRNFCVWLGTSEQEAKKFYNVCHKLWDGGAVSTALIADRLCISVGKAKLMIEACLAWELPISKANGMWVF